MTMPDRVIQSVSVGPEGDLQIAFYTPETDVKAAGVVLLSTLIVPVGVEYDDEIQAVLDAVKHLVSDVLEDFPKLPAMEE